MLHLGDRLPASAASSANARFGAVKSSFPTMLLQRDQHEGACGSELLLLRVYRQCVVSTLYWNAGRHEGIMTLAMFVGGRRQRIVVPVGRRQLTGYIVICNNSVLKYLVAMGKQAKHSQGSLQRAETAVGLMA